MYDELVRFTKAHAEQYKDSKEYFNGLASFVDTASLVEADCANWDRRRKFGAFIFCGEDASGAALLASCSDKHIYRVLGVSSSLGKMLCAQNRCSAEQIAGRVALRLTLLPLAGAITYDALVCGSSVPTDQGALARVATALREGTVLSSLPEVAPTPLLGKRVKIEGLVATPELNGRHGRASHFSDEKGRYVVQLEGQGPSGESSFLIKASNLREAAPSQEEIILTLTESELQLQRTLTALSSVQDSMWVYRRLDYSEKSNPNHIVTVIAGDGNIVGSFFSRKLAPTVQEYLDSVKDLSTKYHKKPSTIMFDEKTAIERLGVVLGPAGVTALYYPPPSPEEEAFHNRHQGVDDAVTRS